MGHPFRSSAMADGLRRCNKRSVGHESALPGSRLNVTHHLLSTPGSPQSLRNWRPPRIGSSIRVHGNVELDGSFDGVRNNAVMLGGIEKCASSPLVHQRDLELNAELN